MKWIEEVELSSMNVGLYIDKLQETGFFSTDLYHDYNRLHPNPFDIIDYSEKFDAIDYMLKVISYAFDNNIFLTSIEKFDYEDFFSEMYSKYCYEQ